MSDLIGYRIRGGLPVTEIEKLNVPFKNAVITGQVEKAGFAAVIGHNTEVGNTEEFIWEPGGVQVLPSTAGVGSIVSTSADDAHGGVGAQTVVIEGLDAAWAQVNEIVTLSGTTPVSTVNEYLRINSVYCDDAGSAGVNVGVVDISIAGNLQSRVDARDGIAMSGSFTVPSGHFGLVESSSFCIGGDTECEINLNVITPGKCRKVILTLSAAQTCIVGEPISIPIPEKSTIYVTGRNASGPGNTNNISCFWNMWCFAETESLISPFRLESGHNI